MNQFPPGHPPETIATARGYREIDDLLPLHWTRGQVTANGIHQHYYRTGGEKPTVLLLHGFMEGALSWLRTALALQSDFDLVMVDARGHGRSSRIQGQFSQELLTRDVVAFARALGLDQLDVLGFSQGGLTGIHVADAEPGLVRSLIVAGWGEVQRADFSQSEGYRHWLAGFIAWLERLKGLFHADRMEAALDQHPPGAPLLSEVEYVPWVENSAHLDLDLVRMGDDLWADVVERTDAARQALGRLRGPVLVMKSSFFPEPSGEIQIEEQPSEHPHVRVVEFKNAGHLIPRVAFDPFVALVREYLATADGRGDSR